ncbi:hypothetical protein DPMN_069303 [Dreissena polymorpha]|uniref:Uncharacterized protein n=1 Tax=Dreissena polymorpha TaxID=45954 RepID=A0A9D3YYS5_DREPO|nr:hypothetical protein DPMN_069303 [Dreissena polymorpha]
MPRTLMHALVLLFIVVLRKADCQGQFNSMMPFQQSRMQARTIAPTFTQASTMNTGRHADNFSRAAKLQPQVNPNIPSQPQPGLRDARMIQPSSQVRQPQSSENRFVRQRVQQRERIPVPVPTIPTPVSIISLTPVPFVHSPMPQQWRKETSASNTKTLTNPRSIQSRQWPLVQTHSNIVNDQSDQSSLKNVNGNDETMSAPSLLEPVRGFDAREFDLLAMSRPLGFDTFTGGNRQAAAQDVVQINNILTSFETLTSENAHARINNLGQSRDATNVSWHREDIRHSRPANTEPDTLTFLERKINGNSRSTDQEISPNTRESRFVASSHHSNTLDQHIDNNPQADTTRPTWMNRLSEQASERSQSPGWESTIEARASVRNNNIFGQPLGNLPRRTQTIQQESRTHWWNDYSTEEQSTTRRPVAHVPQSRKQELQSPQVGLSNNFLSWLMSDNPTHNLSSTGSVQFQPQNTAVRRSDDLRRGGSFDTVRQRQATTTTTEAPIAMWWQTENTMTPDANQRSLTEVRRPINGGSTQNSERAVIQTANNNILSASTQVAESTSQSAATSVITTGSRFGLNWLNDINDIFLSNNRSSDQSRGAEFWANLHQTEPAQQSQTVRQTLSPPIATQSQPTSANPTVSHTRQDSLNPSASVQQAGNAGVPAVLSPDKDFIPSQDISLKNTLSG